MGKPELSIEQMAKIAEPWTDLTLKEQDEVLWRCMSNPIEFCNEPLMTGGSKLRPRQAEIISQLYATTDGGPLRKGNRKYTVGICVAGMSSGKTHLASRIEGFETALLLQYEHPAAQWGLAKGSWIRIINVATSETQSKETVWDEFKDTLLKRSPYLMSFHPTILTNSVKFNSHHVHLASLGSSALSSVGRNLKCAIIDEMAKFETETGKRSGKFVFDSLTRSTTRFGRDGFEPIRKQKIRGC